MSLRAGSSVVAAVAEGEQSTSQVEARSDGSFLVSCLGGSVGVIPLQGGKGVFIEAGQSLNISAQGELSGLAQPATLSVSTAPSPPASVESPPDVRIRKSHRRVLLIGLAAVGTGAVAALLSSRPRRPIPLHPRNLRHPPSQPSGPGDGCQGHHHHGNGCNPHVVIGLTLHF
jgi:hypothetical protein